MKSQTRPVIVEVKRKRGFQERGGSIWGGVDLSAVAAEIAAEAEEQPSGRPVDSSTPSTDLEIKHEPKLGEQMADPQQSDVAQVPVEAPASLEAPKLTTRTPRAKKAKAESRQRIAKVTAKPIAEAAQSQPAHARGKRKIHSENERAQKLARIEKSIRHGETIKAAVGQAGISEQTYYQWKKGAATPASTGDELTDLVELEAENLRLKKRLAEHLRKENAELKKRLGEA